MKFGEAQTRSALHKPLLQIAALNEFQDAICVENFTFRTRSQFFFHHYG